MGKQTSRSSGNLQYTLYRMTPVQVHHSMYYLSMKFINCLTSCEIPLNNKGAPVALKTNALRGCR